MDAEGSLSLFDEAGGGRGSLRVAGIDEAGRGPLAGSVYAAAVILDPESPIEGVTDSKALTEKRRDALFERIQAEALAWHIALATPEEIDELNILQATFLAMRRAVEGLSPAPGQALVDGNRAPSLGIPAQAIVKGDAREPAIGAASILAKVSRDWDMLRLHAEYPDYGFDRHKGYPTRQHMEQLARIGPCPAHRRSFAPVKKALQGSTD